jgi:hypothetical protein
MASEIRALAAELLEARGGRDGRCRVPDSLRRKVVNAVVKRRASGSFAKDTIQTLGLHEVTFYRWIQELGLSETWAKKTPVATTPAKRVSSRALVPVRVADHVSMTEESRRGAFVVTTPGGLRIEGLDLDGLCSLIARCG